MEREGKMWIGKGEVEGKDRYGMENGSKGVGVMGARSQNEAIRDET